MIGDDDMKEILITETISCGDKTSSSSYHLRFLIDNRDDNYIINKHPRYPHSVRSEYLDYQKWDCIQGVSSYLRSVITTRSVLQAAGVGSGDATPLAAALVWILKDGAGMIASLSFAYLYCDVFEVYTKEWRLFADVLNNIALSIDLICPYFPHLFLLLSSLSTICKSCCGLIAGATKARISAHFAMDGHLADVTAKESTQETAVALVGLVLGMILCSFIQTDETSTWITFIVLLIVHQFSNYQLIRVLVFDTFNPQRSYLIAKQEIDNNNNNNNNNNLFADPKTISKMETLWLPFYLNYYGPILGASIDELVKPFNNNNNNNNNNVKKKILKDLFQLWVSEPFIISINIEHRIIILLEDNCNNDEILKSFLIANYIYCYQYKDKYNSKNSNNYNVFDELLEMINISAPKALKWFNQIFNHNNNNNNNSWNKKDVLLQPGKSRYKLKSL